MDKILVTGGCGYIGSHTIVDLIDHGYEVVSVDSCINSDETVLKAIKSITGVQVQNYQTDLCNLKLTEIIFQQHPDFSGIIHFAALKSVEESVYNPITYFRNNIDSFINILDCAIRYQVPNIIYSSSCTVYGNALELPVTEDSPVLEAESPYGRTKQIGEMMLKDCVNNKPLCGISLRYFNPAGAHPSAVMGESPVNPATNLVPIITETAIGKREYMEVFGADYNTRDGSCIRDYVHIMDLARAHRLSFEYLTGKSQMHLFEVFNLGSGKGNTVFEVIHAFEKVSDRKLNYKVGKKREGDVVAIFADYSKAQKHLGWEPQYHIEDMMRSAWKWELYRTNQNPPNIV